MYNVIIHFFCNLSRGNRCWWYLS